EPAAKGVGPLPGDEVKDPGRAAGWVNQAREHLQGRGLTGPVRSQKGDHLARLDGKAHSIDRANFLVFSPVEAAERPEDPFLLLPNPVVFAEAKRLDNCHGGFGLRSRAARPVCASFPRRPSLLDSPADPSPPLWSLATFPATVASRSATQAHGIPA